MENIDIKKDAKKRISYSLQKAQSIPSGELDSAFLRNAKTRIKIMKGHLGAQAQRFIRDLREDTARGIQRKLDKGVAPILAPPGYKNDTHLTQGERTISPHPIYFDLVRQIFTLALTGCYSVQKLYEKAKEMGIKNNRGKEISKTQMYRVLTNPFYKGEFVYAGEMYDGIHKPMITNEEYEIIKDQLKERSKPRGSEHDWSLRGLLKCGICGRQITAEEHVKKSGKVCSYYKCTGFSRYKCPQVYIPTYKLEQQAYDFLGKIKVSSRFVSWAIKVLKRATDEEKEAYKEKFKALRKEQDEVKDKLYKLQMKWATTEKIDEEIYERGVSELRTRRKQIYKMLEKEDKDFDLTTDITIETFKFARDAQKKWETGDLMYRKGIMRVVGSSLVLNEKGRLEIKPRTPFLIIEKALRNEAKVQPTPKMRYTRLNSVINPKTGSEDFRYSILGG